MGTLYSTSRERAEAEARYKERQQAIADVEARERRKFASKIVAVVVDKINHEIIRPGPTPEERECYDVAHEIRDLSPELVELVAAVIQVKEDEG